MPMRGTRPTDLPVWEKAARIITVNAREDLKALTDRMGKPIEHLGTDRVSWTAHLLALRPHQWLKNLLVLLPMLAAHRFETAVSCRALRPSLPSALWRPACTCSTICSTCRRTDPSTQAQPGTRFWVDSDLSRQHNNTRTFRRRTCRGSSTRLALRSGAGRLFPRRAGLFTGAQAQGGDRHLRAGGLYTLRVLAGAAATGMSLSVWIAAFCLFLFMSLAAVKRQAELVDLAKRKELSAAGRGYRVDDLPIVSMVAITSGFVSVLVLALYINSPAVLLLYDHPTLLWGVAFILLYWIIYMVMVAHRGAMTDDPIIFAATDRTSQICLLLSAQPLQPAPASGLHEANGRETVFLMGASGSPWPRRAAASRTFSPRSRADATRTALRQWPQLWRRGLNPGGTLWNCRTLDRFISFDHTQWHSRLRSGRAAA